MKKLIILSMATSVFVLGVGSQEAWAGHRRHRDSDDYRTFKKIVRILDAVVNNGHRRRRGATVVIKTDHYPRRIHGKRRYAKTHYRKHHGHRGHRGRRWHDRSHRTPLNVRRNFDRGHRHFHH